MILVSTRVKELMAERNWEAMSHHELELLRGMVETSLDPKYMNALQKKRDERQQHKHMEEKPFQFDIKEYVKQAEKPVIDEVFLKAFYRLPEEEQGDIIALLQFKSRGRDMQGREYNNMHEGIWARRLMVFIDQWMEAQTKEWVATEVAVAKTGAKQDRVKASREE